MADEYEFQSEETPLLEKASKVEILREFDKKAARLAYKQLELEETAQALDTAQQQAQEFKVQRNEARRDARVLKQDKKDLEFLAEDLAELCRHALRYDSNHHNSVELAAEIQQKINRAYERIAERHRSRSALVEMTDAADEPTTEPDREIH